MTLRRPVLTALLALVLGLLSALAVACGDGGDDSRLLAPRSADRIRAALDDLEERVERGRCDGLDEDLDRLSQAVAAVPSSVDRELRVRLGDGVQHLREIAPDDCRDNEPETTETTPETVPETTPETVETTPPETVETTPPETTTQPPPTTTTPPPEQPDEPVLPEDTGGDQAPGAAVPPGQAKKGDKG